MRRTKLFVSYSHRDRPWLERLKVHLALLQRNGFVHMWSDTRIEIGARWQEEIELALTESRAAVLLVSADFLASDFIWNEEMPRILAHQKEGMAVLPLIARPCAWRIAPELAALQARPVDGRALSLGTDAEVDRDLADFVYEMAGRLEQLPAAVASEERDNVRAQATAAATVPATTFASVVHPSSATETCSIEPGEVWVGVYHPTERQLRLLIVNREERHFRGTVQYMEDGSITEVDGECLDVQEAAAHTALPELSHISAADFAVAFRETWISKQGQRPPQLGGEYLALVSGPRMTGVWQSGGKTLGHFELQIEM